MRIGIDTRMSGPHVGGGGLGRYVEQLARELPKIAPEDHFVLFSPKIHWYTLKEQLFLPRLIDKEHLDLVHFPHWNVPIGIKTPFVVTIHDLILLAEPRSARITTKDPLIFAIKYKAFRMVLSNAINHACKIITVSEATKADICKYFPYISPKKIVVIYEGVTSLPHSITPTPRLHNSTTPPYLLYVGNAYPHKNLETLLAAFKLLHASFPDLQLVCAGRTDVFQDRLLSVVQTEQMRSRIRFEKNPTDEALAHLYAHAALYVFPSRKEGFGLPPLEAMQFGVPVAASNIPSLWEVLGKAAAFFSPNDPKDIARVISHVLQDPQKQQELIHHGKERIKRYSWKKMAEQTLNIYRSCVHQKTH